MFAGPLPREGRQDQSRQAGHMKAIGRQAKIKHRQRERDSGKEGERTRERQRIFGNNFIIREPYGRRESRPNCCHTNQKSMEKEAKTNDSHTLTYTHSHTCIDTHSCALGQTHGRPMQVRTLSKFLKTHSRLCRALITTRRGQPARSRGGDREGRSRSRSAL